jgi:hypothetical protein
MSTIINALPNDAHPTSVPAQQAPTHEPRFGLNSEVVNAVVGSLGDGMPLPTRDIPTAGAAMATDEQVQPNHVTVDDDYIARLTAAGQPSSDHEMVRPPEVHDIYLLPATAALAALIIMLPITSTALKKWTPQNFWHTDGTGKLVFHVFRAALVGISVWGVNQYA